MIAQTRYYNDGKEKYQSHEMHVEHHSIQPMGSGDYNGSVDLTGYGANKDEATANLRASLQHLIHDAQETLASLPTPQVPEPPAVSSEFDAAFVGSLELAVRVGQRKLKESQDPEFQRRRFAQELKTQLVEAAAKEQRMHVLHVHVSMRDTAETIFEQCTERVPGFRYRMNGGAAVPGVLAYGISFPAST